MRLYSKDSSLRIRSIVILMLNHADARDGGRRPAIVGKPYLQDVAQPNHLSS